jgi:ATP-dependent Clp protease adaptor protein ClpS
MPLSNPRNGGNGWRFRKLPETTTRPDVDTDVERRQYLLPPYAVVLHNDDVHAMVEVVQALRRSVPGMSAVKAARIMLEAHNSGQAVVIVCPLEQAEYYQQRLQTYKLTVSIRRA